MFPIAADGPDATLKAMAKSVIYWVKDRLPAKLSQSAWDGAPFHEEWPGQKVEAISIPEFGHYAFRLEHPDMPHGDRPAVPGRTWTTDIAFLIGDNGVEVGIRSFCASLPYGNDAEIALTRPRIILELARRHGLDDQWTLSRNPWCPNSEDDLKQLEEFLSDDRRRLPVVVLTQPDKSRFIVPVADYVIDAHELANRCCGIAHVVQLPWELGFRWTEMIGKPWSVFLGRRH